MRKELSRKKLKTLLFYEFSTESLVLSSSLDVELIFFFEYSKNKVNSFEIPMVLCCVPPAGSLAQAPADAQPSRHHYERITAPLVSRPQAICANLLNAEYRSTFCSKIIIPISTFRT